MSGGFWVNTIFIQTQDIGAFKFEQFLDVRNIVVRKVSHVKVNNGNEFNLGPLGPKIIVSALGLICLIVRLGFMG